MEPKWLPFTPQTINHSLPSATSRVLGVGELVELILNQLPVADIVRCRRVSKKFLETVTYSKTIKQKLHLDRVSTTERIDNALAPKWFHLAKDGYRPNTVAAQIDLWSLWDGSLQDVRPLWDRMLISQPAPTTCVIPVGQHTTMYHRRCYDKGMTFGDLERAVIAAYEIRKGLKSSKERLEELSAYSKALMYLP